MVFLHLPHSFIFNAGINNSIDLELSYSTEYKNPLSIDGVLKQAIFSFVKIKCDNIQCAELKQLLKHNIENGFGLKNNNYICFSGKSHEQIEWNNYKYFRFAKYNNDESWLFQAYSDRYDEKIVYFINH